MAGGMKPRFLLPEEMQKGGTTVAVATEPTPAEAPQETPVVTLTMDQLKALILEAKAPVSAPGFDPTEFAKAMHKVQRPENVNAPMVSVFNPRGETAHPRPEFIAKKVTQNGVYLDRDTLTWEEIVAINSLPPGEWRVTKANGVRIPFTVKFVRGFDEETIERMEFYFPCRDEHREDHRGIFDYCVEVLEQSGREADAKSVVDLKRQLDKERAALRVA